MSRYVLDASAIIAYLSNEPGEPVVTALLSDPNNTCYAHVMNLCEVYYHLIRKTDIAQARKGI